MRKMPTNEERQIVAYSLRNLASYRKVDKELVEDVLGLYMGECVDGYDPVSVVHVADLIEPEPERTCKMRNHDTDNYYMRCCSCSECNAGWFEDIYDKPFSYCPHCGAKVVE